MAEASLAFPIMAEHFDCAGDFVLPARDDADLAALEAYCETAVGLGLLDAAEVLIDVLDAADGDFDAEQDDWGEQESHIAASYLVDQSDPAAFYRRPALLKPLEKIEEELDWYSADQLRRALGLVE
jgi:hypothetical protein